MIPALRLSTPVRDALARAPIAHRGLWSPKGPPENSLAAFAAARDGGYGVELDVRLSADGVAMVFHDAHLARMTGAGANFEDKDAEALQALRLRDTREGVPRLSEALAALSGAPVVLVELKPASAGPDALAAAVLSDLEAADVPLAVIGFDARAHAWFAENRPELPRGLNLPENASSSAAEAKDLARAAPAFLLPPLSRLAEDEIRAARAGGAFVVGWTSRSPAAHEAALPLCDNLIFEGYLP